MSNPTSFKFELGVRVKDSVSSFEGVVLGRCHWLTGCNQYVVTPTELDKDGKRRDGEWFDENRLEVVFEGKNVTGIAKSTARDIGGPVDVPSRRLG